MNINRLQARRVVAWERVAEAHRMGEHEAWVAELEAELVEAEQAEWEAFIYAEGL